MHISFLYMIGGIRIGLAEVAITLLALFILFLLIRNIAMRQPEE